MRWRKGRTEDAERIEKLIRERGYLEAERERCTAERQHVREAYAAWSDKELVVEAYVWWREAATNPAIMESFKRATELPE